MNFLERLQEKPNEAKTQYAFVTAFLVTLVIAVVWITTLPAHFADTEITSSPEENGQGNLGSFADVLQDARDQVGNIIDASTEEIQDTETSSLDSLGTEEESSENQTESVEESPENYTEPVEEPSEEPRTVLIEIKNEENEESE